MHSTKQAQHDLDVLRQYLQNLPRLADGNREERIAHAKGNFQYFCQTYFSHYLGDNPTKETSDFRSTIYQRIAPLSKKHNKLTFFAYRGGAKTTLLSRLYPLWRLANGSVKHILLISDTIDMALSNLQLMKVEIENNANFCYDFGIKVGDTWTNDEVAINTSDTAAKIKCYGSGKRIRGANFLGKRPDLIVLDDIENDENVRSKQQRDKLFNWYTKAILKLPSRTTQYTLIVIGTILHHDSVLVRIGKRQDHFNMRFPLVKHFPKHMADWEALYNMGDSDKARRLYENNKRHYHAGGRLDDTQLNWFDILMEYFEDRAGFLSEYQNQPMTSEQLVFPEYTTFERLPPIDKYTIGIDPAVGKSKKGDYFALAWIGYNCEQKRFYGSAMGYKINANRMIPKIIQLYLKLSSKAPTTIICETVAFQEFYKDMLVATAREHDIHLPIKAIKPKSAKELRIERLSPLIADGTLQIDVKAQLLKEELDTYPKSAHDDLLDAFEMAYSLQTKSQAYDYQSAERLSQSFLPSMNTNAYA